MKNQQSYKLIAVILLATTLAACGGGDEVSTTTTGTTSAGTTDTTPVPSNPLAPDFPNLQSCIANRWVLLGDQLRQGLQAVGDGVTDVSGNETVVFSADGSYSVTPAYTINFSRRGTSGTSQYSGTATGTWSIDGDRLSRTSNSTSVTVTNNIGGVTTSTSGTAGTTITVKVISCTPATLTFEQTLSSGSVVRSVLVI